MVRRTITLPDSLDTRVREHVGDNESFSAAITRLVEAALERDSEPLAWIGSGQSGDPDLALHLEEVMEELLAAADLND